MASAAEQMASNVSWATLGKATELRQRIFFTIGLLIVYRIGTYIPVPGIDAVALQDFMDRAAHLGWVAFCRCLPVVRCRGWVSLHWALCLTFRHRSLFSYWAQCSQAVEAAERKRANKGAKRLNQYTRYGTVILATAQAIWAGC